MVRAHPVARAKPRRAPRALAAYHRKRDLRQSGEPGGSSHVPQESVPVFIVQKHDATRLHYDFRLEGGGVLKSWAVPKGLPMKTGGKALAIEVEDHPLDYGGFEGTIPAGNYGGGTVMLWDRGVYVVEGDYAEAYRQGHIHVALAGEKLRGEWTLVRLRPRPGEKKTSWLIIRNHSSGKLPRVALSRTPRDRSVLSGRSMAESPRGESSFRGAPSSPKKKSPETASGGGETGVAPRFVEPMKALGVTAIPAGDWRCEIKFDGYRALAGVQHGIAPRLWSRNGKSLAGDYPEVVAALRKLRCRAALIDGEIVALDAAGRSHFQLLQQRGTAETRPPIFYYAFDLLQLDGRSLRDEPIETRRAALDRLLARAPAPLRLSTVFTVPPEQLLREAGRLGLEGIVAKAAGSHYEPGRRSGAWLKCRISSEQEFVIGGYTPPEGQPDAFRRAARRLLCTRPAAVRGQSRHGLRPAQTGGAARPVWVAGMVGVPFCESAGDEPAAVSGEAMNASAMRRVHWLKPDLVCQVRFSEWTGDGRLRQPVFLGLRRDKRAAEVVREAPGVR